jgi:hypothetical protein
LETANLLNVPQLAKRAYWELYTRSEFGRIDAEVDDNEVEEIVRTQSQLPQSVFMGLIRLRERLLPEWTRITRTPPVGGSCARAAKALTPATRPTACYLEYGSWHRVILEVDVRGMTIEARRMDPISALEAMIVGIDWEKEGRFCAGCVKAWKKVWTEDREKCWEMACSEYASSLSNATPFLS